MSGGAMPNAPASRCSCGRRATRRGRCEQHQPTWSTKSANAKTMTGAQRARFRAEQLAREPQCRACGSTERLEADHIIPIAEGGARFDAANGQTLCHDCHERKSMRERLRGAARARRNRSSTG